MAVQRPNALGLFLCRMIIVEEQSRNVTLANTFRKIEFTTFPTPPTPLEVYSVLTDGLGEITLKLIVTQCATLEEIYGRSLKLTFHDPRRQLAIHWKVRSCSFPSPGAYEFSLQEGGETITQTVLQVVEIGSQDE